MSRAKLINAFNLLAEAAAMVALELEASEAPQTERALPPVAASAVDGPVRPSAAARPVDPSRCPKHGVAYLPSKNPDWQPYCPEQTDDPAWSNAKGYCNLNPKKAPDWVRVNGLPA